MFENGVSVNPLLRVHALFSMIKITFLKFWIYSLVQFFRLFHCEQSHQPSLPSISFELWKKSCRKIVFRKKSFSLKRLCWKRIKLVSLEFQLSFGSNIQRTMISCWSFPNQTSFEIEVGFFQPRFSNWFFPTHGFHFVDNSYIPCHFLGPSKHFRCLHDRIQPFHSWHSHTQHTYHHLHHCWNRNRRFSDGQKRDSLWYHWSDIYR